MGMGYIATIIDNTSKLQGVEDEPSSKHIWLVSLSQKISLQRLMALLDESRRKLVVLEDLSSPGGNDFEILATKAKLPIFDLSLDKSTVNQKIWDWLSKQINHTLLSSNNESELAGSVGGVLSLKAQKSKQPATPKVQKTEHATPKHDHARQEISSTAGTGAYTTTAAMHELPKIIAELDVNGSIIQNIGTAYPNNLNAAQQNLANLSTQFHDKLNIASPKLDPSTLKSLILTTTPLFKLATISYAAVSNIEPGKNREPMPAFSTGAQYSSDHSAVKLIRSTYHNELAIVEDLSFESSSVSHTETIESGPNASYSKNVQSLRNLLKKDSKSMAQVSYQFELVTSYADCLKIIRSTGNIKHFASQDISPRLGYGYPQEIDQLKLEEDYNNLFDTSLQLYSKNTDSSSAQGYCLGGHKLRHRLWLDIPQLMQLAKLDLEVISPLIEELALLHPTVAGHIDAVQKKTSPKQ